MIQSRTGSSMSVWLLIIDVDKKSFTALDLELNWLEFVTWKKLFFQQWSESSLGRPSSCDSTSIKFCLQACYSCCFADRCSKVMKIQPCSAPTYSCWNYRVSFGTMTDYPVYIFSFMLWRKDGPLDILFGHHLTWC